MNISRDEWVAAYAKALGVAAPDQGAINDLLGLAGVAAHASERTAAPISCYLAALAGVAPDEALRVATELAAGDHDAGTTRAGAE